MSGSAADIDRATHIVLPGVGSFDAAMRALEPLRGSLDAARARGAKILGICLGMQVMMETGEEGAGGVGLGWVRGTCRKMHAPRLPHCGWNEVVPAAAAAAAEPAGYAYFSHSYTVVPVDDEVVVARTEYGESFVSTMCLGLVTGVQWHPEKSQDYGRRFLREWVV